MLLRAGDASVVCGGPLVKGWERGSSGFTCRTRLVLGLPGEEGLQCGSWKVYVFLHFGLFFFSLGNLKSKMHVSSCSLCITPKMYIIHHAQT